MSVRIGECRLCKTQKDANAFCVIQLEKLTEFNKKVENLH